MKNKLAAASLFLAAVPTLAYSVAMDHSLKYSDKTFYLFQPELNKCVTWNKFLGTGGCGNDNASRLASTFQFESAGGGRLRLASTGVAVFSSNSTNNNLCLTAENAGVSGSRVDLKTCTASGTDAERFRFITTSGRPGRYLIQNVRYTSPGPATCLSSSGGNNNFQMRTCNGSDNGQIFELGYLRDMVHVTMENKSWRNMTFKFASVDEAGNRHFDTAMPWGGLNTTRYSLHPVVGHSARNTVENIVVTDEGKKVTLTSAEPGTSYTVESHGTAGNHSMKSTREDVIPQIELFEGVNFTGNRHLFSQDQTNLLALNNKIGSIKIPAGYQVRFYEGANFNGGYYTRNAGNIADARNFGNKVDSFQVLSGGSKGLYVYADQNFGGESYIFTQSQRDLMGFSNKMSSYKIPGGWKVRFYEGKNFTGKYYTRDSVNQSAERATDNKIESFEILSR